MNKRAWFVRLAALAFLVVVPKPRFPLPSYDKCAQGPAKQLTASFIVAATMLLLYMIKATWSEPNSEELRWIPFCLWWVVSMWLYAKTCAAA